MRTIMMTNNIKITSIFRFFFWYCSAYRKRREKSRHFPQNQASLVSSPILCIADLLATDSFITTFHQFTRIQHAWKGPWPGSTASQEALVSQEALMRCGTCHPDIGGRQRSAFSSRSPLLPLPWGPLSPGRPSGGCTVCRDTLPSYWNHSAG